MYRLCNLLKKKIKMTNKRVYKKPQLLSKVTTILKKFISSLRKSKFTISIWIGVFLTSLLSLPIRDHFHEYVDAFGIFLGITIFCAYIFTYKFILQHFTDTQDKQWLMPVVYSAFTILLALAYLMPVMWLEVVKTDMKVFEAFYFSIMTLTTVGYGDLSPAGKAGQALSISMSIVGTLNMIALISTLVGKLESAKQ